MSLYKVPLYGSVWNMIQSMLPTKVHAIAMSGNKCGPLRQGFHSHFKSGKSRNIHNTPLTMATKLPDSVETMLAELAQKNCIEPAREDAREKLASLGEKSALFILQKISGIKIRYLTGLIFHIIQTQPIPVHLVSKSRELNHESPTSLNLSKADSHQWNLPDGFSGATRDEYPISGERRQTYAIEGDSGRRERKLPIFTEHMKALGKLDFPIVFLVLSYITPYALEEVLSVQDVHDLQGLPFADVQSYLRKAVAMKANPSLPCEGKKYEWKPNKTHEYHCYVDCEGNCTFQGPFSIYKTTHLQRVLGDSNVLQVHFAKEKTKDRPFDPNAEHIKRFQKMAKEGILVGLRLYKFFVFKDGDKENNKNPMASSVKCYFVCTESSAEADRKSSYILFDKSIHQSRCMFMHAHTVPSLKKYMARFSLILSNTIRFEGDISKVEIKRIKDIPCMDEEMKEAHDINGEPLIQTDGTGFISEDLASQCPTDIYEGIKCNEDSKGCPLLIQCRLFYKGCAVKGTLLVNRELPCKSIHIRGSMIKVEGDASLVGFKTISSLEICTTSRKPKPAALSRYLIALLNYGGVPEDFFIEHVQKAFDQIQNEFRERRKALKAVKKHKNLDDYHMALRMLSCGIPLHEPLLQSELKKYMLEEIQNFKRGKVPLEGSFYLMGTADPTGQLKRDEVCVILDHGQISGKVLVYRHPGVHFGDIHVFKATYVKDIEKIVGDSKFAIFFSIQGPRSTADEIAKGDFDGDTYWVSTNAKVLKHFKPGTPWERPVKDKRMPQPRPVDFSYEELEDKLIQEFLDLHFAPSYAIGVAADCWLAYMDRLLTPEVKDTKERETLKKKMLRLTDIYYDALDAPKSGRKVEVPEDLRPWRKPHFLNKNPEDEDTDRFYISSSILGKIYDQKPSDTGSQLDEIWTIPCFQDADVGEFKAIWKAHYDQSRLDMTEALKSAGSSKSLRSSNANTVIQKYKEILYDKTSLTTSSKSRQRVYLEASALYQVVYEYAQEVKNIGKCAFAWKVAGEALCEMYLEKQQQEHILISPSIFYESVS